MIKRSKLAREIEKGVLIASRRRCCLCVYLLQNHDTKRGQIAHLNGNPSDNRSENLVWLCLDHHDEYDSRTSQSKNYTVAEVRQYREQLYRKNRRDVEGGRELIELEPLPKTTIFERLRADYPNEIGFVDRSWRFGLWQVANEPELFAYKAGNRCDGICLIERIDLPDGRIVIACIGIPGNPGQSITNAAEELCFQVCERFEIPPTKLVWLEHYDFYANDGWELVTFEEMPPEAPFRRPHWTPVDDEIWQNLKLMPKKRMSSRHKSYGSKLRKLFDWPTQGIFE